MTWNARRTYYKSSDDNSVGWGPYNMIRFPISFINFWGIFSMNVNSMIVALSHTIDHNIYSLKHVTSCLSMKCVSFRAIARIFNNKKLQKEIKLMNYVKRLKGISDHWFFFVLSKQAYSKFLSHAIAFILKWCNYLRRLTKLHKRLWFMCNRQNMSF